ncbi:hypothetical protein [Arthrobacter sp. MYb213]|uniref:hypothetical protein n=1 Tax=Arthrobacter sp. MYb213 TaxID=1848595 RepID=UPI000CFC3EF8|nr:hypothetical protein [Arthrobacter sp. MYb213]PRB69302.1 hypothetical protein CQ011_10995 [Arthrobacter sp. MYb213]
MSHSTKRIIGSVSLFVVLAGIVALLFVSATSPTFLKNDTKLTAEANAGTPIVQAIKTPDPTPTPTPNKIENPAQEWADDMINLLLNGNSKSTFADFNPEIAHHYIEAWSQPRPGVLAIEVRDRDWSKCDLDALGTNVLATAGWDNPRLKRVEVSTGDAKPQVVERNSESALPPSCA